MKVLAICLRSYWGNEFKNASKRKYIDEGRQETVTRAMHDVRALYEPRSQIYWIQAGR
jgi:hypothetical protein